MSKTVLDPDEFRLKVTQFLPSFTFQPRLRDLEPSLLVVGLSSSASLGFYRLQAIRHQKSRLWPLLELQHKLASQPETKHWKELEHLYDVCFIPDSETKAEAISWFKTTFPGWLLPEPEFFFQWSRTDELICHIYPNIICDPAEDTTDSPVPSLSSEVEAENYRISWQKAISKRVPAQVPKESITILAGQEHPREVRFLTCCKPPAATLRLLCIYSALTEFVMPYNGDALQLFKFLFNRDAASVGWFKERFVDEEVPPLPDWQALDTRQNTPYQTFLLSRPVPVEFSFLFPH